MKAEKNHRTFFFLFSAIFFLSGSASLVYQVVWMKEMSLFFGSDMFASGITLAAFMGGLALGAFIAGFFADKIKRPILVYGILEISIGVYALFFGPALSLLDPLLAKSYATFYDNTPEIYHTIRFSIAFVLLLLPTALMGATLPIVLKAFTRSTSELGKTTGHFYAINTFGALAGVFISGFVMLPAIGIYFTKLTAVGLNLVLGMASIALAKVSLFNFQNISGTDHADSTREPELEKVHTPSLRNTALIAAATCGFAGLGLEVLWNKILVQSFSATVYSFSMMLVAFLLGIALGSRTIESRISSSGNALKILAKVQLLAGFSVAILSCLTFLIAPVFGNLVWSISAISPGMFGFSSVFGVLLVSSLFILPTTVLLGASFPAALKVYNNALNKTGSDSGFILFVNTLGSVAGALLTAFVLIPAIGSLNALVLFAAVFLLNGIYVYYKIPGAHFKKITLPVGITVVFMIIAAFIPRQVVLNYNMQQNKQPKVIHHAEGVMGFIDVIRNQNNETILSINGNIEADNSLTQLRHFILKAHLPLLLVNNPEHVLVVGLGLGITTSSILKHRDIERVDIIELSPDIVKAQKHLKDVNDDVLSDPRINLKIDDGRNYLKFTREKYDLITADPIHPRISGVGVLYTEEYYRLIRERLNENGVVLQWMPVYSISPESYQIAVGTMAKIFPNTTVWYVTGHTLLLGMKSENEMAIDFELLQRKLGEPEILKDLERIGIHEPLDLLQLQILSSKQLQSFLEKGKNSKLNTEALPYLEYKTPFEFLHQPREILDALAPFWVNPEINLVNSPIGLIEKLDSLQKSYRNNIRLP